MIAIDTNILIHAHRRDSPWYAKAEVAVRSVAEGTEPWAIPWQCIHEFLSVSTNPRIFPDAAPTAVARQQVEYWLASPSLELLSEKRSHWPTLTEQLEAGLVRGAMVHDARVAAICLQHGVTTLWSADRDFSRFPRLRVVNPLI